MKASRHARPLFPLGFALVLAVYAAACSDNPVDEGDEDHAEPAEVIVTLAGDTLVRATPASATGGITVAEGEETDHLEVVFLDADGDELPPEDDHYLDVEIEEGGEEYVEIEQDTPGEFGIHVHGLKAGHAHVRFKLMHGEVGAGHSDFTSEEVEVEVTEAAGSES